MFPADFAYARARTLDEALDLLDEAHADDQEAKLIAGGQSLLPMMKLRLAAPQVLIDIADLPGLRSGGWMGSAARRLSGRFHRGPQHLPGACPQRAAQRRAHPWP